MNIKRAVFMAVLVLAIAALALPLVGLRAAASGSAATASAAAAKARAVNAATAAQPSQQQKDVSDAQADRSQEGKISAATLKLLGINRVADPRAASAKMAKRLLSKSKKGDGQVSIQSGQPVTLDARSALSDALITAIGGRDNQFSEVALIADWDGREDCVADREQKVDDFSFAESEIDVELTRTAIGEHTVANGFNENVYYYGDSVGNLWVGVDTNPQVSINPIGAVDTVNQVNIPTLLNGGTSGGFTLGVGIVSGGVGYFGCADDQVTVTGIAVNPVADLCDFGQPGVIGEIVYVSVVDTEGCASIFPSPGPLPGRTSILEFAFTDGAGLAAATPAGSRRIFVSTLVDFAGVAVDDDGSLYFQLLDIINFAGGAIFKLTELPRLTCDGSACISRVIPTVAGGGAAYSVAIIPTTINVWQGTGTNPIPTILGIRATNYSGPSTLFGNIIAINTGPCNVVWAAVSASFVDGPVTFDQLTQGLFKAPTQFTNGTPSMVISFADCQGLVDGCSGQASFPDQVDPNVGGTLPRADGFADVANAGVTTRIPGVNNFRIFVQGFGPALDPPTSTVVPSTPSGLLKIAMQIDYVPAHAGIAVSQEGTVFVISGGAPAGVGKSPSAMFSEVLCFEDICPADRRADPVDLRTTGTFPNPAQGAGNVGDKVSDRFDHIFYQAPVDVNTATPAGLAGLNFGFLRYTNRLAPNGMGINQTPVIDVETGLPLGQIGGTGILGNDSTTTTAIVFESLDPGHQVAGGDDQIGPFTGDDNDGAGSPPLTGLLQGGFEFLFGGPVGTAGCVWNGFFWNSNGNLTFGTGDTSRFANVPAFRQGRPKIAPAWAKLNPASRAEFCNTFPVMALGFANVNAFKIRWINVPEEGREFCTANASNTFSVILYDDGTGAVVTGQATSSDENNSRAFLSTNPSGNNSSPFDWKEGPTDLRFTVEPNTGVNVGCPPRPSGSGIFVFEYCRMDLLGTPTRPVLTGFSIGFGSGLNPPGTGFIGGLCEINISKAAREAVTTFGVLPSANNETAAVACNCCIGEGTEPELFELFNEGSDASIGAGGEVTLAKPDFDLRFEGNDAALCTSPRQKDPNTGRVCFFGIGCAPPADPICRAVVAGTFVVTPNSGGPDLIDAICQVQLNLVGCGFFPNEVTTICSGFEAETGIPLQRPGKTVTTAATLVCDNNGDGIADATIVLASVTPVSCNLLRATFNTLASRPGTAFPDVCCGGTATINVTTTFTEGDNNVFGPFTRSTQCTLALGTRAPVVFSVTPSGGNCALPIQDLLVSGACFCAADGTFSVTSVIFQDASNPANTITIGLNPSANGQIKPLTCNLFDVEVRFTSANAGKTFLFFAVGPGGTSRNQTGAVTGQPGAPCPTTGNEQGFQVTFTCNAPGTPGPGQTPDIASVTTCKLDRKDTGQFFLDVTGTNIKEGFKVTVGGVTPKKIKTLEVAPGTTNPTKVRLLKKICAGLPGNVIITNPGPNGQPSQPLLCNERCPAN